VTVLTSLRYAGLSPKQLVPQLADEGLYLASESTMYRVQRRHGLRTKKRATARTHVTRAATVHQARGPNQVWSWDITWLPTTVRGSYGFQLNIHSTFVAVSLPAFHNIKERV